MQVIFWDFFDIVERSCGELNHLVTQFPRLTSFARDDRFLSWLICIIQRGSGKFNFIAL